jgi:hypothetical protein
MKKSYRETVRDWELLVLLCRYNFDLPAILALPSPGGSSPPQQPAPSEPPGSVTEKP